MKAGITILFPILLVVLSGCSNGKEVKDSVIVEYGGSISSFVDNIDFVNLVPLETDDVHILGSMVDLTLAGDSYIVSDCMNGNIFRYSLEGQFLNRIGRRGNGPEEYVHVNNVQYYDSSLVVFSAPSKFQRFSLDGKMLETKIYQEMDFGMMSWLTDCGLLTYYGYGSMQGSRFAFIKDGDKDTFYPSTDKVMNMTPYAPIFSESSNVVYIVDSYSDVVKKCVDGKVTDGVVFDLGKYSIPHSFYEYEDSFAAMEFLMSREYAMINQYMVDGLRSFVSVAVQKQMSQELYCGFLNGQNWSWFPAGKMEQDVLAGSFELMKDGSLYCIWEPSLLRTLPSSLRKKIANSEVLDSICESDNYIVAQIIMK